MIGGVIITHGSLAESLLEAAGLISGDTENVLTVSVECADATEEARERLSAAVAEADSGDGVIIFTDMFGGTPSNIALSFFKDGRVDVITGVNLPVLIKFIGNRKTMPLAALARALKETGTGSIVLASEMLGERED